MLPPDGFCREETPDSTGNPNPLNSSTIIRFSVGSGFPIEVCLKVYDLQSRLVEELFDKPAISGMNRVIWDNTNEAGEQLASGAQISSRRGKRYS